MTLRGALAFVLILALASPVPATAAPPTINAVLRLTGDVTLDALPNGLVSHQGGTLTLGTLTAGGAVRIASDDRITVAGTVRGNSIDLRASRLIDFAAGGGIVTDDGGAVRLTSPAIVLAGPIDASGPFGGRIDLHANNLLAASAIRAG